MSNGDTGYVQAYGECCVCRRLFYFNPHRVPSYRPPSGERMPICEACITIVNARRTEHGLEPWPVLDGAYEPMPAAEL